MRRPPPATGSAPGRGADGADAGADAALGIVDAASGDQDIGSSRDDLGDIAGAKAAVNCAAARALGQTAAEAALAKGLSRVVVDRGGFRYHGRVKELVEAAVAAGLSISDKDKTEEESK